MGEAGESPASHEIAELVVVGALVLQVNIGSQNAQALRGLPEHLVAVDAATVFQAERLGFTPSDVGQVCPDGELLGPSKGLPESRGPGRCRGAGWRAAAPGRLSSGWRVRPGPGGRAGVGASGERGPWFSTTAPEGAGHPSRRLWSFPLVVAFPRGSLVAFGSVRSEHVVWDWVVKPVIEEVAGHWVVEPAGVGLRE